MLSVGDTHQVQKVSSVKEWRKEQREKDDWSSESKETTEENEKRDNANVCEDDESCDLLSVCWIWKLQTDKGN